MRNYLNSLAELQLNHTKKLLLLGLIVTAVLATGINDIELQTDFQDSLPDELAPIQAQEEVEAKFGNQDAIIVLYETTKDSKEPSYVSDIRDPRVIRSMKFLEAELEREPIVESTNSMASLFETNPESIEDVKKRIEISGGSFTNRDYTATTIFVRLSEESNEENIIDATETINQNIEQSPNYPGVNIRVTGTPVVRTDIGDILVSGLEGQGGPRLRAVPSTDLVARPQAYLRGRRPLVVNFGRSGNSSETVGTLDALDVHRIAVATPYTEELNELEREYLTENGFEVVQLDGRGIVENTAIGALRATDAERQGRSVLADTPDADALFISCTNYRSLPARASLETEFGVPVVSSNAAAIWDLCGRIGVQPELDIELAATAPVDGA